MTGRLKQRAAYCRRRVKALEQRSEGLSMSELVRRLDACRCPSKPLAERIKQEIVLTRAGVKNPDARSRIIEEYERWPF